MNSDIFRPIAILEILQLWLEPFSENTLSNIKSTMSTKSHSQKWPYKHHTVRKFMLLENVGHVLSKDLADVLDYLIKD